VEKVETITNTNYKDSKLENLEELDAIIFQIQSKLFDIKAIEAQNCNDADITTVGEYIDKYPDIFISTYNHNDEILLTVSEKCWSLKVKSFEEYEDVTNTDIEKIIQETLNYLKLN
jgi:hypothetical protein